MDDTSADNPVLATFPGGTDAATSLGPLRSGLVPRKVTYPFEKNVFYASELRAISRSPFRPRKTSATVRCRQKRVALAGGHGVWAIFARH